jgi:hypothetical protein
MYTSLIALLFSQSVPYLRFLQLIFFLVKLLLARTYETHLQELMFIFHNQRFK